MIKSTALVKQLLERYPNTRDSDNVLIIGFLQARGANLTESQKELIRGISFEGITRARRKYQQQGEFLSSDGVNRQRRLKARRISHIAPKAKPAEIQTVIQRNEQERLL